MKKMVKMSLVAALVASASAVSVQADDIEILSNGKLNVQIRPRYEMVEQDAKKNANAFTNRLTIGGGADLFGTSWLSAYAEATNVSALNDNYDDWDTTTAGDTAHAVVADGEQTRITQAYIDAKFGKTLFRVGRQAINLDNQRFIGSVDWRQMPQTFDAYALVDNSIENLSIVAAYITNVNRVFSDDSVHTHTPTTKASELDTRTAVVNISYKVMPELKITAYDYMIGGGTGLNGAAGYGVGSDTMGVALTGDIDAGVKLNYRAEYAIQKDPTLENSGFSKGTAVEPDSEYMNFELGANISGILAGVQYESLGANDNADGVAFAGSLGTLHAHNGWADMFLVTPAAGLVDMNVMLGYTSKEFGTAKVIYHEFESDAGSTDLGSEIDAIYMRAIPSVKGLNGMLKYARYEQGDSATYVDTTKFWAMLNYNFSTK